MRFHRFFLPGIVCLACLSPLARAVPTPPANPTMSTITSETYQVVELRRYTIKPGKRAEFASYFEAYFPEAFQQLGALALGQGLERDHENGFTWLRGFQTMDARAV